jgi:prolipoprotein diacylglyceryltransferase
LPIHPTPLYSILWNVVIGVFLFRLWFLEAPLPLVCGLYLILNGLGRFVEEAYRGEPQTPILGKLRLYQVMAITSVSAGIALTMMQTPIIAPIPEFSWNAIAAAACFGVVTWIALGVDFPNSNKRFARLA